MKHLAHAALLTLLNTGAILACSCIGPNPACSAYWTTPVVFLGSVVKIDAPPATPSSIADYLVYFDVTKSYRGTSDQQAVIHTAVQGSACGVPFEKGHTYLVYAYTNDNGSISTGRCTRTHEVTDPAEDADLQWIEALPKSPPTASIFGHISSLRPNEKGGLDSTDLPEIRVSIEGPDSKIVSSGEDGNFRADGLTPGKYVVSATAPRGYAPFFSSSPTLQARSCAEVDWSTRIDGHIRGHVYFSNGDPVSGLYLAVKLADSTNEPWTWQAHYASTSPDGAFDFGYLAPGSYILAANMDFPPHDGKPYYRRAFFPNGSAPRSAAGVLTLGTAEVIDNLRFFLPPDAAPPSATVTVTVAAPDGQPVPHAEIFAYDDIWENSVMPVIAAADDDGKAKLTLRPGLHYDIVAVAQSPESSQSCAEPASVDVRDQTPAVQLVITHPIGNCIQFKKPR